MPRYPIPTPERRPSAKDDPVVQVAGRLVSVVCELVSEDHGVRTQLVFVGSGPHAFGGELRDPIAQLIALGLDQP